jgi:serine/threonine protein phosphatase 1
MKRNIIIGDLHGCLDELKQMLRLVQFQRGKDRMIFLGDYFDRGPDGVGVFKLVRELAESSGAVALMGNHDETFQDLQRDRERQSMLIRIREVNAAGRALKLAPVYELFQACF